jgi:hypothetical protein
MSVPSGTASLSDIQTEFGGSNPISMSEYYDLQSNPSGIPSSGALSIDNFRGKDNVYTLTSDIFTSSITLTADDINGSGAAWVGVSGGGGGGAGVIYATSATGSGAPGGAGGIHGLFVSDVTDLIGASFVAGGGGGGSTTGHTPGSSGRSSRGNPGGTSTFSYGNVTAAAGSGGLGGPSGSGARDPGNTGADTGINITSSIASYYSGKVTAGTTGALRGSAGAAGPAVLTGGENTPGTSYGGAGGSGNLTIIYEAVPQVT